MSGVGQYILSVIAAALICSIILRISSSSGKTGLVMKLLCGVFLVCTAISPWIDVRMDDFNYIMQGLSKDTEYAVATGQDAAQTEMRNIIKQKVEAYISNKATLLKANVKVEVIMSDDNPTIPGSTRITGLISPYAKQCLTQYIADELGIPEEKQIWI